VLKIHQIQVDHFLIITVGGEKKQKETVDEDK
jgi:hypothetical protein